MENEQAPPPPPPPMPSSNDHVVIVHGLPSSVSEETIRRFFSRILTDPIQQLTIDRSSSTAELHLAHAEDVEEALTVIDAPFDTTTDADGDAPSSEVLIRVTLPGAAPNNDPNNNNNNNDAAGAANEAQPYYTATSTSSTTTTIAGLPEALKVVVRDIPNVGNAAEGLRQLFSECGELRDVSLDPRRPIAYLTFCDAAGVEAALQREGVEWNGAVLHVERKRLPPPRQSRLVVKHLPENALSEEGVRRLFGDCGDLHDIFVNVEKRIAFIAFLDEASAEKALAKNGVRPPAADQEEGRGDEEGSAAALPLVVERRERQKCFKCNREGHLAVDCRSSAVVCRECGRPGHIARDCRSARQHHPHYHQGGGGAGRGPSSFRGGPPSSSHSHLRFNGGRGGVGGYPGPARRPGGGFGGAGSSLDRRRHDMGPSSRGYGDDSPRDVGRRRRRSFSDDRDDRRRRRRSSSPRRTRRSRSRSRSPPRRSPRRSRSPRRRRSRTPPARR